ncbi:hypothetical protein FQZ97_745460 [compost metagenome]
MLGAVLHVIATGFTIDTGQSKGRVCRLPVCPKISQLLVLEHAEGFAGIVFAHDVGRVEDVAQFFLGKAVEFGVVLIQLGAQGGAAVGVEGEGRAFVAQLSGPGGEVVGGVGQFQYARDDEIEVGFGITVWGQDGELLQVAIRQVCAAYFHTSAVVEHQ